MGIQYGAISLDFVHKEPKVKHENIFSKRLMNAQKREIKISYGKRVQPSCISSIMGAKYGSRSLAFVHKKQKMKMFFKNISECSRVRK